MGISVGKVIDYLYSGTSPKTGTTLLADLLAVDPSVVLADNVAYSSSQSYVFIGRRDPTNSEAGNGTRQFLHLGQLESDEDYMIPCYISVNRPGPAQKPSRDIAIALFDAFAHWVQSDLTMGGVLQRGRSANINQVNLTQTLDEGDTGGGALRDAWVSFDIQCKNQYIP